MQPRARTARGLRERIKAEREARPDQARDRGAQLRADAVLSDYAERKAGLRPGEPVSVGGVTFHSVTPLGNGGIEIRTAPNAIESHYRIFNPPTLVQRGTGDITIRGKGYVEEPLEAVARLILSERADRKRSAHR